MVSKSQIKLITSLQQKKFRTANSLFIAEGQKVIGELLAAGLSLDHLYMTEPLFPGIESKKKSIVSQADLKKLSALTTANNCLAVFEIPAPEPIVETGLVLALDDVRDPG